MESILLQGCVCTTILSFTSHEFLYTGTVCRAWKENSTSPTTDIAFAFQSPARITEAVENGISCQCPDREKGDTDSCDFFMEYAELVDADISVFRKIHELGYGWGDYTMQNAAIGHKTEVVRFMHENGCPLSKTVLYNAVTADCLELVEYLAENECPIDDTLTGGEMCFPVRAMEQAVTRNSLGVLRCLHEKMDYRFADDTFRIACEAEYPANMKILRYLRDAGCRPDEELFYDSIEDGNYYATKFMLDNALYPDRGPTAMRVAVINFQGNIMELLVDHGFEISDSVVSLATYDIGLIRWFMRVRNCKLTSDAYFNTVSYDMHHSSCLDMLNWLYHKCRLKIETSFQHMLQDQKWSAALDKRHPKIAAWFQQHLATTSPGQKRTLDACLP